jgi:hypothetical protein
MAELMFVVALVLPPAVVVLAAVALAIGSIPRQAGSAARLRAHHA